MSNGWTRLVNKTQVLRFERFDLITLHTGLRNDGPVSSVSVGDSILCCQLFLSVCLCNEQKNNKKNPNPQTPQNQSNKNPPTENAKTNNNNQTKGKPNPTQKTFPKPQTYPPLPLVQKTPKPNQNKKTLNELFLKLWSMISAN